MMGRVSGAVRADRAVGAVLAGAAGDALGAAHEFGPPLADDAVVAMVGGGPFGWEPGEWTDDTQMALAVLHSLADPRVVASGQVIAAVEDGFRAWHASGPADVGNQTRAVLGAAAEPGSLAAAAASFTAANPRVAAGNGSLMRTGPIALAHRGERVAVAELARAVSSLTHPDPDCVDACVLWSVAIDHAIHHAPMSDEPFDWAAAVSAGLDLVPAERRDRWRDLIAEAAGAEPVAFTATNGWVVAAFQAALAAICSTPVPEGPAACGHLQLALAKAVRGGGDTDTLAAIAGSLLGARWGATAVPLRWRALLHGRRIYGEPALSAADLDALARLAFDRGRPDPSGWPGVASLLDVYGADLRVAGTGSHLVELDGVLFGNVGDVGRALEAGADVVVSLCRMGSDDVPAGVEHHSIGLIDSGAADNPNAVFLLADLADTIAAWVAEGRRPFVHCVAAESRTPTVAAAHLHRHGGLTAAAALDRVATELGGPKNAHLRSTIGELDAIPVQAVG